MPARRKLDSRVLVGDENVADLRLRIPDSDTSYRVTLHSVEF